MQDLNRLKQIDLHFSAVKSSQTLPIIEPKLIVIRHTASSTEFILNRPKALNSVDFDMITSMKNELIKWHKDPTLAPRVLMIKGTGNKAFCAGGDIVSLFRAGDQGVDWQKLLAVFSQEYVLTYSLSQLKNTV